METYSLEEKHRNFDRLVTRTAYQNNDAYVDKCVEVLVEGYSKMIPKNIPAGQGPKIVNFSALEIL